MDLELAELSRTIDAKELGRRIRNARIAAGLTQAAVAGGDVTAAYLSRIEDGQRRPEASLLERMANRMGITLRALLVSETTSQSAEMELALDHAELALVSGSGQIALEQVEAALPRISDLQDAELERRALRLRAGALEATGDLNGAILVLERLTAKPSPDATWLKSLIALCRCYRDSGEFARAIAVGERTSAIIEELGIGGLTEAIQLTVTVASAHHRLGDLGLAMRTCMEALEAAELHDSPIAKASAYWNASSIKAAAEGATPETLELAKKALALFELGEDNRNIAKLRAEVANLHLSSTPPDPDAALDVLERAEGELAWSAASVWERALLHLFRGRAHALRGEFLEVQIDVGRAREFLPENAPVLAASAFALEGQVAVADGRVDDARHLYRRAVMELTGVGADRDTAEMWFELAHLLSEVGETQAAMEAFRSAGASSGFRMPATTRSVTT